MARYHELVERKRIAFVTFHQTYSYEDFVEGLRPEIGANKNNDEEAEAGFRLEPRKGIFKAIADRAIADRGKSAPETMDFFRPTGIQDVAWSCCEG